ncbi:hypothetical protein [Tepidibacter hydrothermalis]|uniref:Lipoprotein n=1 Tax=Tepidibacter hydrothermalis TaxID=3036126 RepID=A0ABY8EJD4_9FIRM|nr:hypothetical protein [Tepidibacter hydrothermalis]WFD11130.1 hypothetical protein P4S50_03375 [Tepidibacter hydrothermalis]
MKKIITMGIVLVLGLSMIACTNKDESSMSQEEIKQESSIEKEGTKQDITSDSEVSKKENVTKEDEKNSLEKYIKLIGLSREEIIDAIGEEPNVVDEGGLEFLSEDIRVWFGEDGKSVNEIAIYNSDIDFNGASVGGKIDDFKNIFGKPVLEDNVSGYSNFDYKGLVLSIAYDPSTDKVVGASLIKEWK